LTVQAGCGGGVRRLGRRPPSAVNVDVDADIEDTDL
jgi:hypothetical protein